MSLFQMMGSKPLLQLLILFLGFSYLLSPAAGYGNEDHANEEILAQMNYRNMLMVEEKLMREDMEVVRNDYAGSGANDRHEPKTPGSGR